MSVGDIYRVTLSQTLHAQQVLNTLYYRETVNGGASPATALALRVAQVVVPPLKAVQSNELSHLEVLAQKIWPQPVALPASDISAAGAGGVASSSLPTSNAVVITKTTLFAGRKYRGRVFIGGVPVSAEDDSKLAAAVTASWVVFAQTLAAVLVSGGYTFVPIIYHKTTHTDDQIQNAIVRTILRVQRRREIGKGR